MGCRIKVRAFGMALSALIAAAQAGCAGPETDRSPSEVLAIASAGLEGVDRYTFRSRTAVRAGGVELQELESYEGEIAGHAVRMIRSLSGNSARESDEAETPASRLAELARRKAEVGYAGKAPACCLVLSVKLSGDEAARDVKARLTKQFEQAAKRAEEELAGAVLPDADAGKAEDFRGAVARETERFRRELARMLEGLEAEATVLVTIDRRTMLPLSFEETVVLRYEAGGRTRTEEQVTRTTLEGFDGRPSSS